MIIKTMAFILSLPLIAKVIIWVLSTTLNPSPDKIAQAGGLIAQAVVPWWLPIIQFLASWGTLGAIVAFVLLFFVVKSGTLEG